MEDKDRAQVLVELYKVQMSRFQSTQKTQWTLNTLLWAALVGSTTISFSSEVEDAIDSQIEYVYICFAIYCTCIILIQFSLNHDKKLISKYRRQIEAHAEVQSFQSKRDFNWIKSWLWIIIQCLLTFSVLQIIIKYILL